MLLFFNKKKEKRKSNTVQGAAKTLFKASTDIIENSEVIEIQRNNTVMVNYRFITKFITINKTISNGQNTCGLHFTKHGLGIFCNTL